LKRAEKEKMLNRYCGKDRPGKVSSPNGPLGSRWAYPPGIAESGVGPLETIAGLVVFVLLAMVGAEASRGVVANRKDALQVEVSGNDAAAVPERGALTPVDSPVDAPVDSADGGASGGRTTSRNMSDRINPDRNGMVKDSRGGRG
jgi:hypothetical protein